MYFNCNLQTAGLVLTGDRNVQLPLQKSGSGKGPSSVSLHDFKGLNRVYQCNDSLSTGSRDCSLSDGDDKLLDQVVFVGLGYINVAP